MAEASTMRGKVLRGLAKHRFAQEDNEPVHVLDNVWIGSIGAASNAGALHRKGVTHVLSLCSDELPQHADIIYKVVRDLPDKPGADLRSRLPEMCDFVQNSLDAGKRRSKGGAAVLVSCFQGKSRSASVIAAFLMRRHGFTVAQALDEVPLAVAAMGT